MLALSLTGYPYYNYPVDFATSVNFSLTYLNPDDIEGIMKQVGCVLIAIQYLQFFKINFINTLFYLKRVRYKRFDSMPLCGPISYACDKNYTKYLLC